MAERITKVRECDRGGCRRRKGVREIDLVLRGEKDGGIQETIHIVNCELCPGHVHMVKRFMDNLVTNTKEYDNGTD